MTTNQAPQRYCPRCGKPEHGSLACVNAPDSSQGNTYIPIRGYEDKMSPDLSQRRLVKPILLYWHCKMWWRLADGAICPMEHDTPIYDERPRRGRKRRAWVCQHGEGGIAYLSREEFLTHDEDYCYADY